MMAPADPLTHLRTLLDEGRFREAVAWRRGAEPMLSGRPEGRLMAATAAMRAGEVDLSRMDATAALEEFVARADQDGRMRCHNLLGAIAFEQGKVAEARTAFATGLSLAEELGDALVVARASNNLASVAHLRGRAEEALSLYRTALLAYQRLGDRRGAAETYHNLAVTFRDMELWPDALDAVAEAVRHADMTGDAWLQALVLAGKAELHLAMDDTDLAAQVLEQAAALAEKAGDRVGIGEAHRLRALIALARDDAGTALAEAEAGRAIGSGVGSALLEGECAAAAARACLVLGEDEAFQRYRETAEERFTALGATRFLADFRRHISE